MKKRQGRILVVEDAQEWRDVVVKALRTRGYAVDSAATARDALAYLKNNLYHLLILDMELANEDGSATEDSSQDGLFILSEMVKQGLNEATKVVVLSVHGEYMRPAFRLYSVLDYIEKDDEFSDIGFVQEIDQIFAEKLKMNLALDTHWQRGIKPEEVILNLDMGDIKIAPGSPFHDLMVTELDNLFCRLFRQASRVLVQPAATGWSGTEVIRVMPFYPTGGRGHEVIVKFGNCRKIEAEYTNFTEYVQPFLGGEHNTSIIAMNRTTHLAGITYSLLGTTKALVVDFGEFYRLNTATRIEAALDRLFWHTCGAWYASRGKLDLVDLAADYQRLFSYPPEELETDFSGQPTISTPSERTISFKALPGNRTFINPLTQLQDLTFSYPTYVCITHGDFNHRNLLVDEAGNTWLIDFQGTGPGHILRDVAALDSTIRFQLLTAKEASLEERLRMEETLLGDIEHFHQVEQLVDRFSTKNQSLAKAFATAVHLRTIAWKLAVLNPQDEDDISEYYVALFYNALNTWRFSDLPPEQREHALLCASLLMDRLELRR